MKNTQDIRKIQTTLTKINNKEKVFYNIGVYKKLGLVQEKWSTRVDSWGDKVEELDFVLTEKAKRYINVII